MGGHHPAIACLFCDAPAVAYCDAPVAMARVGGTDEYPLMGFNAEGVGVFTCDAPLCAVHRHPIGHVCYRGRNKKCSDTIDHCDYHHRRNERPPILDTAAAEAERRRVHALIRRERLR